MTSVKPLLLVACLLPLSLVGCQKMGPDPNDTTISVGIQFKKGEAGLDGKEWLESFEQAKEVAARTGRPILADFTGSDWCHYCELLHNEVFSKPAFHDWAAENVVLLELDFPQRSAQSVELATQNQKLSDAYGITGFPTVLFLDEQGKPIGRSGYLPGGPETWIADAKKNL